MERDGLWTLCGIVDDHQDVLMAPGRLEQQPYEIHALPLKRDHDDGKGNQWGQGWPVRGGLLALVVYLSHYSRPVKLVPDLLQCILGSQVAV